MSKYVKELVTRDIRRRLEGVDDAVAETLAKWQEGDVVPEILSHLEPCQAEPRVATWWLTIR